MNKNILYIVTEDWYFFSHRAKLAQEAIEKGYNVYVYTNFNEHEKKIQQLGIKTIPSKFSRGLNPFSDVLTVSDIFFLILKIKPNIIHSVALKPVALVAFITSFIPKIHNIYAISGLGSVFTKKSKKYLILSKLISMFFKVFIKRKNSTIIVQNQSDYDTIHTIIPKVPIHLLRGAGVNTNVFKPKNVPLSNERIRVLMASRLLWSKGIKDYLEAALRLNQKEITYEFAIAGSTDPGNVDSLKESDILELKKQYPVTWLGSISNMHEVLPEYDVFVLPTYYGEGIPKVLIEAASCGLPIITTDTPGCNDIVQNDKNGFLVPPRKPDFISEKLELLRTNKDIYKIFSQNARQRVLDHFSTDIIYSQTIELYEK